MGLDKSTYLPDLSRKIKGDSARRVPWGGFGFFVELHNFENIQAIATKLYKTSKIILMQSLAGNIMWNNSSLHPPRQQGRGGAGGGGGGIPPPIPLVAGDQRKH